MGRKRAGALVLFVPVADDAPATARCKGLHRKRDWRGSIGGGKNASADDQRTLATDAARAAIFAMRITAPLLPPVKARGSTATNVNLRNIRRVVARRDF
jgi:hypothetical protein